MEDSFCVLAVGAAEGGEKGLITGLRNNPFHNCTFLFF